MAISITPSPFGSVTVTLDGELGGVLSVGVLATSNSALNMDLGVPGPQGEAGEPGANGQNGQGVAAGGLTNQVLVKLSNDDFDTGWANAGTGDYLPLTGGTMSGDITFSVDGNGNDSLLGAFGFGVENTNGQVAYIQPDVFRIYDNDHLTGTSLNGEGITFNDTTVQTTAGLPLTGGTMTGSLSITNTEVGNFSLDFPIDGALTISDLLAETSVSIAGGGITINNLNGSLSVAGVEIGFINNALGSGILFSDSSVQTTAFPPAGGTSSQYIDGTGALETFPPLGDRYFTTSNSTLTCDSGNGKTMTVGTGLSYSRQQDITVSYNNANHMHGTVLTYDPATGVMTFDSNTHSGGGTYSSWEVNVGGVAGAVLPVGGTAGQVLAKINSTNFNTEWISLGSMATQPASAYLSTASAVANYLTISNASSTYQTQSGMSAYLSTSAASSTYLTQSNASSTYLTQSSAASTYIGTSAYATTAQAQAGTSTTTVISPATLLDAKFFVGGKSLNVNSYTTVTSGTGAIAGTIGMNAQQVASPTTAVGTASRYGSVANSSRGYGYTGALDFTKRVVIGGRFQKQNNTTDSNSIFRFYFGKSNTVNDMTQFDKAIGFRVAGSGALQLTVATGSVLTVTTSSFTPVLNQCYDVVIVSDSGTATMFVNGTQVATSSGSPNTLATQPFFGIEAQNIAIISTPTTYYMVTDLFAQVNV